MIIFKVTINMFKHVKFLKITQVSKQLISQQQITRPNNDNMHNQIIFKLKICMHSQHRLNTFGKVCSNNDRFIFVYLVITNELLIMYKINQERLTRIMYLTYIII